MPEKVFRLQAKVLCLFKKHMGNLWGNVSVRATSLSWIPPTVNPGLISSSHFSDSFNAAAYFDHSFCRFQHGA